MIMRIRAPSVLAARVLLLTVSAGQAKSGTPITACDQVLTTSA
jgi:hypothetical protein